MKTYMLCLMAIIATSCSHNIKQCPEVNIGMTRDEVVFLLSTVSTDNEPLVEGDISKTVTCACNDGSCNMKYYVYFVDGKVKTVDTSIINYSNQSFFGQKRNIGEDKRAKIEVSVYNIFNDDPKYAEYIKEWEFYFSKLDIGNLALLNEKDAQVEIDYLINKDGKLENGKIGIWKSSGPEVFASNVKNAVEGAFRIPKYPKNTFNRYFALRVKFSCVFL